jgi:preprotein translocase subunit SecG
MSLNPPTTTNPTEDGDRLKKWSPLFPFVTALVGAGATYLSQEATDTQFWLVSLLSVVCLIVLSVWLWRAKKATSIFVSTQSNETFEIRRFPRWLPVTCWSLAAALLAFAIVVRFVFRDEVFELARIDKATGSAFLIHRNQEVRQEAILYHLPEHDDAYVYPGINVTLSSHGKGKVYIEAVVVVAEPIPPEEMKLVYGSLYPDNEVIPNIYHARLSRTRQNVEAELYQRGAPSGGMAYIDEGKRVGILNVMMDGEPGLYRVSVRIAVFDERANRHQELTTPQSFFIKPIGTKRPEKTP